MSPSSPARDGLHDTSSIPRLVLVFGMPGDGTTWLVNAVVRLLQIRGINQLWVGWSHELENNQLPDMTSVVRVHEFDPVLASKADFIFCGLRDLRDAVLNGHRALDIPADLSLADNLVSCAEPWEDWADHCVAQEQLVQDPQPSLNRLAEIIAVGPSVTDSLGAELTAFLTENQDGGSDRVGEYAVSLAPNDLAAIETAHQNWLIGHGYQVSDASAAPTADSDAHDTEPEIHPDFQGDYKNLGILKRLGFRPRVVLDVGASTGIWSHTCAQLFPHAIYNLVEALPQKHAGLVHPIDNQQWFMFPVALGSEVSEIDMILPTDGFGVYEASVFGHEKSGRETESIRVKQETIDHLVTTHQMKIPDVVKLDVQGYELEVLRGGDCLWGRTEVFIVETSLFRFTPKCPILFEVVEFFEKRGYQLFDTSGEYRSGNAGVLAQVDLMFIAKAGRVASLIKF